MVCVRYRVMPPMKMAKLVSAIAAFVSNWKKMMLIGVTNPPPPMPPELAIAITIDRTMMPTNSSASIGKTFLCSHISFSQLS